MEKNIQSSNDSQVKPNDQWTPEIENNAEAKSDTKEKEGIEQEGSIKNTK